MKHLLLIVLSVISGNLIYAQDAECKVLLDSLKGTYVGECKNGKQMAQVKPLEQIRMTVSLRMACRKEKANTPGVMAIIITAVGKRAERWQRRITPLWKWNRKTDCRLLEKDNYRGEYENPYVITNVTPDVGRVQVEKMSDKEAAVTVTVESLATGASLNRNTFQTTTTMTAHQVTRGQYVSKSSML